MQFSEAGMHIASERLSLGKRAKLFIAARMDMGEGGQTEEARMFGVDIA